MTRENCAYYPQVTQGVNKMGSQFVLCWIRRGKNITEICFGLSTSVFHLLWAVCLLRVVLGFLFFFFPFGVAVAWRYFCTRMFRFKWLFKMDCKWHQINSWTRDTASKKKRIQCDQLNQSARTKTECEHWHRNYWSWGNWQEPTASKCITYGVPFSQLPQREHKKCYISLSKTNKQPPRYAESF